MYWVYWKEFYSHLLDNPDENSTEQEESSALASATFMDQAWCLWHPIEGCIHFAENWQDVCGQPADRCLEGKFFEFIHTEDQARFFQTLEKLVTQDIQADIQQSETLECRIIQASGEYRWFECLFRFSNKNKDEHPLITFAFRDIQRIVELQNNATEAKKNEAFAEKGRRDFLTHMSHELRTPLNAILGFTQIIQSKALGSLGNSAYDEYVEHIRQSGEELLTKIDNLLHIGEINNEESLRPHAPANASDLVKEAIEMQSHKAFERDISLHYDSSQPNVVLQADHIGLTHAISSLLHNAITYSTQQSAVEVLLEEYFDGSLNITIRDHGDGIALAQLEHMQSALQNENGDHAPHEKGLGIGLLLTNRVAREHDGRLVLHNREEGGVEARIVIPKERVLSRSAKVKAKSKFVVAS